VTPVDLLLAIFGGVIASTLLSGFKGRKSHYASGAMAISVLAAGIYLSSNMAGGIYSLAASVPAAELRVDKATVLFLVTTLSLLAVIGVYSLKYMERRNGDLAYYPLLLLMAAGLAGIILANDLFTLYCFFELASLAAYVLVAFEGEQQEPVEAGIKYLFMSTLGILMTLYTASILYGLSGTTCFEQLRAALQAVPEGMLITKMLGAMMVFGVGVSAAIFPFYTWLPDAHSAAPSPVSAALSGIFVEVAFYAVARVLLYIIPSTWGLGHSMVIIGIVTSLVGSLSMIRQVDLKRILAYSTIVNMGFLFLALGVGYRAFNMGLREGAVLAMTGALLHVISHALGKSLAFMSAGSIIEAVGSRVVSDLEGAVRRMPVTGFTFAVATLSLAGMPPLIGFWSKLFIEYGLVVLVDDPLIVFALAMYTVNILITAGYYFYILARLLRRRELEVREAHPVMWASQLALAVACILLPLTLHALPLLSFLEDCARELGGW